MARLARILRTLTLVVCAAATAADARAQASATTVAIDGIVADSSGGALPGVTVTASSPTLQGVRTAVTNGEGVYRLPQLPPGEYRIAYEMPGFATDRARAPAARGRLQRHHQHRRCRSRRCRRP